MKPGDIITIEGVQYIAKGGDNCEECCAKESTVLCNRLPECDPLDTDEIPIVFERYIKPPADILSERNIGFVDKYHRQAVIDAMEEYAKQFKL